MIGINKTAELKLGTVLLWVLLAFMFGTGFGMAIMDIWRRLYGW